MANIKSRNWLFEGQEFPKPPVALVVRTTDDADVYGCPHCHAEVTVDECDVIGAESDCVFCCNCHGEFEV